MSSSAPGKSCAVSSSRIVGCVAHMACARRNFSSRTAAFHTDMLFQRSDSSLWSNAHSRRTFVGSPTDKDRQLKAFVDKICLEGA